MKKKEVSTRGVILRELIASWNSLDFVKKRGTTNGIRKKITEPTWKVPDGYAVVEVEREHYKGEWFQDEMVHFEGREKYVILQLHGGGYVGALKNTYRSSALLYNKASKGMPVFSIDYRVAPENPFPEALEDAYDAYCFLHERKFDSNQIVLAGDSAGGGLAMALCHLLIQKNEELPAGIIAMSPWTDLTATADSYQDNYELDPLFGNSRDTLLYNSPYIGDEDPRNPLISPLFGNFHGFPPMLLQVGDHEMLLDDTLSVAKKAKEQGVKVRKSVYKGMFHVFQMAMLLLPESRKAWIEVSKFLEKIMLEVEPEKE